MPEFRRAFQPGGTFFFTVVTYQRRPLFNDAVARRALRDALEGTRSRRPFTIDAVVLMPDHLHTLWTLPEGDHDFSTRWRKVKESFTRQFRAENRGEPTVTPGQKRKSLAGFWQQRFWEHTIRDEDDFRRHVDYIHYNPVKHGLAACPHAGEWSSFARWVKADVYEPGWCCCCDDRSTRTPDFSGIPGAAGE